MTSRFVENGRLKVDVLVSFLLWGMSALGVAGGAWYVWLDDAGGLPFEECRLDKADRWRPETGRLHAPR